jgi:hypothetical protein
MKRILFLFSLGLFLGSAMHMRGEEGKILLYQTDAYLGAGTNQWWLPASRLEHLPHWKGNGNPPLSVKRALKIARKWIAPRSGDGDVHHILLRAINADALEARYRYSFYYAIEFCVNPYGNHITCIVLMDGSVLEPLRI